MTTGRKIAVAAVVIVVLGSAAALSVARAGDRGIPVRMEEVARRDLVATVTASGNIRARSSVDISSDVQGRVIELRVEEGRDVEEGQVLLRLDPARYAAAAAQARAALSQAEAQVAEQRATVQQAERAFERTRALQARDSLLVSPQQVEDAETRLDVARAQLESFEFGVSQSRAALEEAEDQLSKTTIRAPISGKVTRLNVETGETVIVGTMNNPGSLILTVSDLSVVEAVVQVDETDVPAIQLGDSAQVELDAFPERVFRGRVTEIGNSAIRPPASTAGTGQTAAIDFEVVITLDDPPEGIRPDLSATADIITATREEAVAIPIISLTVRNPAGELPPVAPEDTVDSPASGEAGPVSRQQRPRNDREGVFRVREGTVSFVPVEIGITGQEYFEVLSGVEPGDTVVAGPYQRIRELEDGDAVRSAETAGNGGA